MLIICVECKMGMAMMQMGVDVVSTDETMVRRGDLYKCEDCKTEVITDFGVPMMKHNLEPGQYERVLAHAKQVGFKADW